MRITTVKVLTKRMFVFLLTGLLLLPSNGIYVISASAADEVALSENVSFPEDTGFSENLVPPEEAELSAEPEELSERAGIAAKPVSLLTVESVTSTNKDGSKTQIEPVNIRYATSKSMWFNDYSGGNW